MGNRPAARPEALRIERENELSEAQDRCARRVEALIAQIALESWTKPEAPRTFFEHLLPRLDRTRANRSVLVDGPRGSGKTTVLLSLLDTWSRHLIGSKPGPLKVSAADAAIVPLNIIDLHPMPSGANLVMSLLSCLYRADRAIVASGPREQGRAAWLNEIEGAGAQDVARWQKLVASVAGWIGGAEARRQHVPAEEFTLELTEQAQRAQDLDEAFHDYVDHLVAELQTRLGRRPLPPLFVVPIDDADMSPHRATELLELLRTFHHPRLVFLLTGDSSLFLTAMRAHYLGGLWRPLHALPAELRQTRAVGPSKYAVRLATEVYDRAIPPHHRIELGHDSTSLLNQPYHRPVTNPEPVRLAEILDRIKLFYSETSAPPDRTLRDLFAPNITGRLDEASNGGLQPWRLRAALPDRLRELVDLIDGLELTLSTGKGEDTSCREPDALTERVLRYLWRRAVLEESLHPHTQEALQRVLKLEDNVQAAQATTAVTVTQIPSASRRRTLLLAAHKFGTSYEYRPLLRFDVSERGMVIGLRSLVRTRLRFFADGVPPSNGAWPESWVNEGEPPVVLSNRLVATLKLITDVLATREQAPLGPDAVPGASSFVGGHLVPSEFEGAFVRVNYYSRKLSANLRFVWRVPQWDSFLDFDLFRRVWEQYAPLAPGPEPLARLFTLVVICVSLRQEPNEFVRKRPALARILPDGQTPEGRDPKCFESLIDLVTWDRLEPAWQVIQSALETAGGGALWWSTRRRKMFMIWRDSVFGTILAPEGGLDKESSDKILSLISFHPNKYDKAEDKAQSSVDMTFERRRHLRASIAVARKVERSEVSESDVDLLEQELELYGFPLTEELRSTAPPAPPGSRWPPNPAPNLESLDRDPSDR